MSKNKDKNYNKTNTESKENRASRVMELLFRALKGESLSVRKLADEYNVSTRSITRDIDALKCFLAERPDVFPGTELVYSGSTHCYMLTLNTLFSNKELAVIAKILVGCRALSKRELTTLLGKLEANTSPIDRDKLKDLILTELHNYSEPASDCPSVIENIWTLTECINNRSTISVFYHRMDRQVVDRRLIPVSIMFSEEYFYLLAYQYNKQKNDYYRKAPLYYRIDRISMITIHRQKVILDFKSPIDEGYIRNRSLYMWPGPARKIIFEFSGPSVQAVLDKLPTAKILSRKKVAHAVHYTIEADTYGNGIKMFLLSQGSWVKVLEPVEFREEMKQEILNMAEKYE